MAEPQRDTVRDMVKEYAKSGLLTQAKAEEMKERYSADRIDYGHNSQKNLLPYTPEQSGFYDYYLQQAEENLQQQIEFTARYAKQPAEWYINPKRPPDTMERT